MRNPIDDDDIDRAYRMAVETTTDVAAAQRRRSTVLEAVEGLKAVHGTAVDRHSAAPGDRTAANEVHRHPAATWWRGVAAACVIGISTLVVVHMQQAPESTEETRLRSDAERVAAPAGKSTATQVAEVAPRRAARPHPRPHPRSSPTCPDARPSCPQRPRPEFRQAPCQNPSRRRRSRRSLAMPLRPPSRPGASDSRAPQPVPWMPLRANLR